MKRTALIRSILLQSCLTILLMVGAIALWETVKGSPVVAQPAAPAVAKTITTESLVIVDAQGRQRAWLGAAPEGAGLSLLDETGKTRLSFRVEPSGAATVAVHDKVGVECTVLAMASEGNTGLLLKNAAGKNRMYFGLTPAGEAGMGFLDGEGRDILSMGLDAKYECGLGIKNAAGKNRFFFGTDPTGGSGMEFLDAEGRTHIAVGVNAKSESGFEIRDVNARPWLSFGVQAKGGGLTMKAPDGKDILGLGFAPTTATVVGLAPSPSPAMYINDLAGKRVWTAP